MKPTWNQTFVAMMATIAQRSDDPDTKLGSIIVSEHNDIVAIGYNGLPRGIPPVPHRLQRPHKYKYMEHAERNAIYNCLRSGTKIPPNSSLYVELFPCTDCARAIIQSGISNVIVSKNQSGNMHKWEEEWKTTKEMFSEAGVTWLILNTE